MRILFISSGNAPGGTGTIVRNQGLSLSERGLDMEYFAVEGRGLGGYLGNVRRLRRHRRGVRYDIYHAHYFLSAIVASLAGCRPLAVSFMGSDAAGGPLKRLLFRIMNALFWDRVIVKSEDMRRETGLRRAEVIPNGVCLDRVRPAEDNTVKDSKTILFAADPSRPYKNYSLAEQAVALLDDERVRLKVVHGVSHHDMISEIAAADVLLLTSLREGSPNVVKEAMACNVPVVATDVGDVSLLFGDCPGCYVCSHDASCLVSGLRQALDSGKPSEGRSRIIKLGLDAGSIAGRLTELYESLTH